MPHIVGLSARAKAPILPSWRPYKTCSYHLRDELATLDERNSSLVPTESVLSQKPTRGQYLWIVGNVCDTVYRPILKAF